MSDYYSESQVNQIEQAAHDGAVFEAGKEWERQRDESNAREHELEVRISELRAFIDQLIEAGDEMSDESYWNENRWQALVDDWKEANND